MIRIGFGFDNHRLTQGRPFLLGGLEIPSPVGEEAHSDGDVLIHALCDALLGSVGKGDIGEHFPDSDPRWKGQASSLFLERTAALVSEAGYRLVNLDATILLEEVKLSPYKRKIAENLCALLGPVWPLEPERISIKAKTMERCDSVGRGESVQAQVAVLVEKCR
jgi:2-C-methyl-D-erythritol 2,4-cyclodiphosphate synthase